MMLGSRILSLGCSLRRCTQLTTITKNQVQCIGHSAVVDQRHEDNTFNLKWRKKADAFMSTIDENSVMLERKQIIDTFIEQWKQKNYVLPQNISNVHWYTMLTENYSYLQTLKYMQYIVITEKKVESDRKRKEKKKVLREQKEQTVDYLDFCIPLSHRDKEINKWQKLQAMKSEIPIVIDLNFPKLTLREQIAAYQQLLLLCGENSKHEQQLQIHFTSIQDNVRTEYMDESPSLFGAHEHKEHFLDLFPREKLLYLSPDGPQLRRFDPDRIYIIGALVDIHHTHRRETFVAAKEMGIQCASLPLDNYVRVGQSSRRELNINLVFDIMQNMYLTHSWKEAFGKAFNEIGTNKYEVMSEDQTRRIRERKRKNRNYFSQYAESWNKD